jgi:N-carbamoyl-L-amino-acid hydrolase
VTNVIAGATEFNIDYRAADDEAYQQMSQRIGEILESVATKHQIQVDAQIMHHTDAEVSKPHIRQAYEQGAQAAGVASQPLVSWAAHDAMNMAKIADSGMMFVPCRDGRSHTPEEYVKPEDVATGVAVLANAMIQLAT